MSAVYGLMAPIAGTLSSRWKPKLMMLAGVIILALAMIGCSRFAHQLWHFYIFFGVMVPVGTALCGWPHTSPALMNWFAYPTGARHGHWAGGEADLALCTA